MQKFLWIIFGLLFFGWLAASADTVQLADGSSLTGDIVTFNDEGVTFRLADDSYTNVAWTKFSQDALKQLSDNPKIKPLAEPFIEPSASERPQKPEVNVQNVTRLELPPKQSLLGALFSSSVGIVIVLLIYAANLYAAFEIAVIRARPIPVVVGVAAVLPILGPILFLSMPMKMETVPAEMQVEGDPERIAMPGAPPKGEIHIVSGSWQQQTPVPGAAAQQQETQIFQRGQFTFNRRFFETKFAGFFGIIRTGEAKNQTLLVKAGGRQLEVERITRIAANDAHFQTAQGEVMVPFAEIQEIQLAPKA
jgi:hypothetical protein